MKAPLVCTHVAEGHKSAVLSVAATDDLMFSSSKGMFVKFGCSDISVEASSCF